MSILMEEVVFEADLFDFLEDEIGCPEMKPMQAFPIYMCGHGNHCNGQGGHATPVLDQPVASARFKGGRLSLFLRMRL